MEIRLKQLFCLVLVQTPFPVSVVVCLCMCLAIGTWFIKGRKSEASQTSATQNGATPINETPDKSPDGTTPKETSICIDGALPAEAIEEPKEVKSKNLKF